LNGELSINIIKCSGLLSQIGSREALAHLTKPKKVPREGSEPGLVEIAARLSGYHCCNVINNSGGKVKSAQIGVWTYI
jgi:hypothetical protein